MEPYERAVPEGQEAWLILYSTVDSAGAQTVGSGVVVAATERGTDPLPTVTIAPGTNGIIPECAPSLKNNIFVTGHEHALTEHLIPAGCAGVIADYNGLGTRGPHAYLDGETAARNVLGSFGELLAAKIPPAISQSPVLIAQGESDQLIRAARQREFAQNQCDSGQNLEYRSYPNLDHMPPRGTRFALYFGFDFVDTPHA